MGSAYKCDSCGNLFEGESENEIGYTTSTETVGIWLKVVVAKKDSDDHAELCPKCKASLLTVACDGLAQQILGAC